MFGEMIENYLARLKDCKFDNNIDIKSVILFGSVARGPGQGAQRYRTHRRGFGPAGAEETGRAAALPIFGPRSGHLDALLEGKVLRDDGTAAAARERLVQSLERLKIRKLEHGWMIPRSDLNAVISFD